MHNTSANKLILYDESNSKEEIIDDNFAGDINSWQAGGRSAYDSKNRIAYVYSNGDQTIRTFDLNTGTESKFSTDKYWTMINISKKTSKLYGKTIGGFGFMKSQSSVLIFTL